MSLNLTDHFSQWTEPGAQQLAVRRRLEFVEKTPIGKKLLEDFYESGGRLGYMPKLPDISGAAFYDGRENVIWLSQRADPSILVHELAHFRQHKKSGKIIKNIWNKSFCLYDRSHLTVIKEADAYAMSVIFMFQYLRDNISNAKNIERFARGHRSSLSYFRRIDPYFFNDKQHSSILALDIKSALKASQNLSDGDQLGWSEEDIICDLEDDDTAMKWAGRIFRNYLIPPDDRVKPSAEIYADGVAHATFKQVSKMSEGQGLREFFGNLIITSDEWLELVSTLSDLNDLNISSDYLENFKSIGWAGIPNPYLVQPFKEWLVQQFPENEAVESVICRHPSLAR